MKLSPLEFRLFRMLGALRGRRLLIAVSGGNDSVALAVLLKKLQPRLDFALMIAHVHHGKASSTAQTDARDLMRKQVELLAQRLEVPFVDASDGRENGGSQSEADLRKFRHEALENARVESRFDYVVFAHHADDLFETRLIRLLRGTGPDGLKAMRVRTKTKLRPLLGVSRKELRTYVETSGFFATEDPSNSSEGPLRNWLRHVWLKELERKRPGSSRALARSLSLLAESNSFRPSASQFSALLPEASGIDRRVFNELSVREKRLVLNTYLRRLSAQDMSHSMIEEVIKRLDTYQKRLMFEVGPLKWSINAQQISADHRD